MKEQVTGAAVQEHVHPNGKRTAPNTQAGDEKHGILIDGLAKMPEKAILDEIRLARILGVSSRTVRRMVARFELPPPVPLAGRSVWLAGRILAHLEAAAERAERDARRTARKIQQLSP